MAESFDSNTYPEGSGPVFRQSIIEIEITDYVTKKKEFLPAAKVYKMYKHVLMEALSLRKKTPSFEDFLSGKVPPVQAPENDND